jgi:hypothetical protein
MDRSKIVAIITGAISIILALAYLLLVQLLDFRGEMIPAPVSQLPQSVVVAQILPNDWYVQKNPNLSSSVGVINCPRGW